MRPNALFIAATGQNVGKTTICLGLQAALRKHFSSVGFIKPVGQQHVNLKNGSRADKDAVLFKELFQLRESYVDINPVLFPSGFTRDHIDGKTDVASLIEKIKQSFSTIHIQNPFTVVEGTGHVGVGSLVGINNADVASMLNLDVVIIAPGGLGSTFDELALNIEMCRHRGINIRGVILNRVIESKREMILDYFPRALKPLGIPLLGCIPYSPLLYSPTMEDFENLFKTKLLAGYDARYRHFREMRLVAGSLDSFLADFHPSELLITPACRKDIIEAVYGGTIASKHPNYKVGVILTGRQPPTEKSLNLISKTSIPTLYAPGCSYDAMKRITSFTAKICKNDTRKIEKAIELVESHLDLETLIGPLVTNEKAHAHLPG